MVVSLHRQGEVYEEPGFKWSIPALRLTGHVMVDEYYDLNITRDAWQMARESLTKASRVILMGYSAPITDLTVAALLGNYADTDVSCLVVDTSPEDVVRRLQSIGLHSAAPLEGDEPIRQFVENYKHDTSRATAESLLTLFDHMELAPEDPAIARVADVNEPRLPISQIRTEADTIVLVAIEWKPGEFVADKALKVRDIRKAIEIAAAGNSHLVVENPNQPTRAVLNVARRIFSGNFLAVEA